MLIYVQKFIYGWMYRQTDGRTTQNYSSQPQNKDKVNISNNRKLVIPYNFRYTKSSVEAQIYALRLRSNSCFEVVPNQIILSIIILFMK
jgi:hypothetical protein